MSIVRSLSVVLLLTLAACGGKKSEPAKPDPAASTGGDVKTVCVKSFTRARECTSDFIPALVDARARHDMPPGIAEQVKTNRDAVIAEAKKEWENDSKDEAISATCDKISAAPDMASESSNFEACTAKSACPDYVGCVIPLQEKHFAK